MSAKRRNLLKNLRLTEVSLVDVPANQEAHVVITKAFAGDDPEAGNGVTKGHLANTEDDDMTLEELTKALENAEATLETLKKGMEEKDAKIADLTTQLTTVTKRAEDAEATIAKGAGGEEDDILKGLSEPLRKRFEDLEKQAKEAAEAVAKAQEKEELGEFVTKAATFDALPVKAADLGALLFRVAKGKSTAIDAAELDRVLTAANTATVEKGLTKPFGRTAPLAKGATAEGKINAAAEELRKADPNLTQHQAIAKAVSADPKLYAEYRAELGMGG